MRKVVCRLNVLMAERGIKTLSELQRRTGISRVSLTKLYNNQATGMAHSTILTLCKELNCGIDDFLVLVEQEEYNKIKTSTEKHYEQYKKGHVYFLKDETIGLTKIGRTSNLERRIQSLNQEYKTELKLVHSIKSEDIQNLEKELHQKFEEHRFEGEWFRLNDEDITSLKKVR